MEKPRNVNQKMSTRLSLIIKGKTLQTTNENIFIELIILPNHCKL
jgi:hypothetical protein